MAKRIFINIAVSDVAKSTAFYEALGFVKQPDFSDEKASAMMWSNEIIVMLLNSNFYKKFLKDKDVADTKKVSSTLLALSLDSKEAVQRFADTAKNNGGEYFRVDMGVPEEMMFGYEVLDLDGHQWEPVWMSADFKPHE